MAIRYFELFLIRVAKLPFLSTSLHQLLVFIMLENHISQLIVSHFQHHPTKDQENAINALSSYTMHREDLEVLMLSGYAGTGKTSLICAYIKTLKNLKHSFVLLAPTGRAAKVLSAFSGENAFTIHKEIYRQKSSSDSFGSFDLNYNKHKDTIFIVDEASMISNLPAERSIFGSGMLLDDLFQYVFTGRHCKLIFIGDTAQLPPVGSELSPALDLSHISGYGFRAAEVQLTEVVRQALESGILYNATTLRNQINADMHGYPKLSLDGFTDVKRVTGEFLIDAIQQSYDLKGINETLIVTRSNKRANQYNQGIRGSILYKETDITNGDMVMVVKNNYLWAEKVNEISFIANGDIAEVLKVRGRHDLYDMHFTDLTLQFPGILNHELDVRVINEALNVDGPSLSNSSVKELYYKVLEDYMDIPSKPKRNLKMKQDPFFNALQIKYAYAVTCHKAQGGQWKDVYIDLGYVTDEMMTPEYLRWLYTAFTRATENVYLVNFPDKFFI